MTSPTQLDREDVVGFYVVDRSKFPGEQADWQYENYSYEIRGEELVLTDRHSGLERSHRIRWSDTPGRWSIRTPISQRHHLLRGGVTLYREAFSHYYVLDSEHYGNVFFRKQPWWWRLRFFQ